MSTSELNFAAANGDLIQIKALVALGIDPNQGNHLGYPILLASQHGHFGIVRYFIDECGAELHHGVLHYVVRAGNLEMVKYLVEHCRLDPNSTSIYPSTLHIAACGGHLNIVQYLVAECCAQVNNQSGETALHKAARLGHLNITRYLVEHGANVHALSKGGDTPLHKAAYRGHLDIVKYLVEECSADVHAKTNYGKTPLDKAKEMDAKHTEADLKSKVTIAEYLCLKI